MRTSGIVAWLCAVLAVLLCLAVTQAGAQEMNGPPGRPKAFKTADELREYLKALNEYFAIVGRPRFGKRSFEESKRMFPSRSQFDLNADGVVTPQEISYLKDMLFDYRK